MSRTVTLADLRRQARELADQEASGATAFVDDTELNGYINAAIGAWHGLLAKCQPERFEAEQSITATGGDGTYALPADYYQTLGVDYVMDASVSYSIPRAMFQERNRYSKTPTSMAEAYRIKGSVIELMPPPSSGTYTHLYVTAAPVLALDADTIDGVNGWEQYIVYDAAARMLLKEESDETAARVLMERDKIEAKMAAAATDREAANPMRIVDVRSRAVRFRDPDFWTRN